MRKWPAVDAFDVELNFCFTNSRRLTGPNRYTRGPAAILTTAGPLAKDADSHRRWLQVATALVTELGWPGCVPRAYPHEAGAELVIPCPGDRLYTATEINEQAWEVACGVGDLDDNFSLPPRDFDVHQRFHEGREVREYFRVIDAAERDPRIDAIRATARRHGIPVLIDDDEISLGGGRSSRSWLLRFLPSWDNIPWTELAAIPIALVTGSNGKTTTVRLLAALIQSDARFRGSVGYSSTEGVVIGGEPAGSGDFAGPAGARMVLRDRRVGAAVLETARGGILRRGLAVDHADVAVVTNVSADHFGEYGVYDLEDLAEVKLAVAHALATTGTLVLNADVAQLLARVPEQQSKVALFARDDAHPALASLRESGGSTCGVRGNVLWLTHAGERFPLGAIAEMPLTLTGAAAYNVANISAAVLAAAALAIPPAGMAAVLEQFGSHQQDNPGRLNRWTVGGVTILIDYAHNPDGLSLLLSACKGLLDAQAESSGHRGRLALLLGQAGNRSDSAIAELACTAAGFAPDIIVTKEIAGMLRGRLPGEVPGLLNDALRNDGYPLEKIHAVADEFDAANYLLGWAQAGDVLVLPIHQSAVRNKLSALLDELETSGWQAGSPLPPDHATVGTLGTLET